MKILFCGLPGSGKSTIAEIVAWNLKAIWINADKVREHYNDWDFTHEGRIRQSQRMKYLADGVVMAGKIAIADFVAPTVQARENFSADKVVWMDTIKEGRFEDTNKIFEPLDESEYGLRIDSWFNDKDEVVKKVINWYNGN